MAVLRVVSRAGQGVSTYFTEMCSGSEAGSYPRLIDFVYHSTLGLRVIKKKRRQGVCAVRRVRCVVSRSYFLQVQVSVVSGTFFSGTGKIRGGGVLPRRAPMVPMDSGYEYLQRVTVSSSYTSILGDIRLWVGVP